MSIYAHLHAHSSYSLLNGLASPAELVQTARAYGMPALAMTDRLCLSGAVEFQTACNAAGIQPIFGLEIDLAPPRFLAAQGITRPGPLVLLAEGPEGWANLCRLTGLLLDSTAQEPTPPISLDVLGGYAHNLICLSGGRRSLVHHLLSHGFKDSGEVLLRQLASLFPQRFYVELNIHTAADQQALPFIAATAHRMDFPMVAAHDTFYLHPDQAALYRTLTAIRLNTTLSGLDPAAVVPQAHFPKPDQMLAAFKDHPEALSNSLEIARQCAFQLPLGQHLFPEISVPAGLTPADLLRREAETGARRLYNTLTPAVQQRLDREIEVISSLGYEPIFLIMQEIIAFARTAGVPVSSRGSAASSLVAHCLGITSPDPLRLNLYFERFLNSARTSPPDIDTDLCSRRRDLVIQHVFDQYGQYRVAMVGTINRYRPRSALGEVAKAYGLSPVEAHKLTNQLPHYWFQDETEPSGEKASPFQVLFPRYPSPSHQQMFRDAEALLKLPRHLSVHAGGIVITPGPLNDLIPTQRASKGMRITQFDHKALEQVGVVKLDLLGIRGLTVLGDVSDAIYSWQRCDYSSALDVLDDIPLEDPETSERIAAGKTIGCFQIESPGMRATLREVRACCVEDLMVALALYRPGPLTGGLKDAFVRRHNHQEAVVHLHPALAPLLDDTYGVILYQEQVLRIAHELAGLSLAESDLLRRAMSHFNPGKQMETLRQKFIDGAQDRHQIEPETGARIWDLMAAFAGYGFPKAHAASYALIAWRSAWCKTHHPAEFMAAVLANWGGYYGQRVYLTESRRMGLEVRPPHINHAQREFSVAYPHGDPVLYMGLDQVRDLTRATQETILRLRPFASLDDFLVRANPRQEEAANLIRVGALEGLGIIPDLLARLKDGQRRPGQLSLFDPQTPTENLMDWSTAQKVAAQEDLLGIGVDAHPLELLAKPIAEAGAMSTAEAVSRTGQRVRVAGIRQSSRRSRTGSGDWMMFLTVEDLEGTIDVVFFPEAYRRSRSVLAQNEPLLIEGIMVMEAGRDEPTLRAERAIPLSPVISKREQ